MGNILKGYRGNKTPLNQFGNADVVTQYNADEPTYSMTGLPIRKRPISLDTGIGTHQWHGQSRGRKKKFFKEHFAQQPEYRRTIDKEDIGVMSKKEKKLYYKTRDNATKNKKNTAYTQKKTKGSGTTRRQKDGAGNQKSEGGCGAGGCTP
jgi:hypothetical protein